MQFWRDSRTLKVLGMGVALPEPPILTSELLVGLQNLFGIAISRRGIALGNQLGITTRRLCRDSNSRHEAPRRGHSNPDLATAGLREALDEARLEVRDLAYLIGHTTTPACLAPPNVAFGADRATFTGRTWSCVKHALALPMHWLSLRASS
jgi:3-oxoacyl-[acyl-carrier-protein] synthase-3